MLLFNNDNDNNKKKKKKKKTPGLPREKKELFLARKLFQADYASPPSFRYGINILLISPIKIQVLDRVVWIFYSSLEERTIEKRNEIKFLIRTHSFTHGRNAWAVLTL